MILAILKALAFSAPNTNPLTTDYVKKSSRGRATAFGGFGAVVGEIFAFGFLFGITAKMSPEN